jgi:hypothetical protein
LVGTASVHASEGVAEFAGLSVKGVGSYQLTATGGSLDSDDSAAFSITARPITVTVTAGQTKVYGATDPVFAYTVTTGSLAAGDTFSGALSRASGENIGTTYAIGVGSLVPGLNSGANYTVTFVPANFSITAKPITVTADSGLHKEEGGVDPVFTYTPATPGVGSDTFSGALGRATGETVGTYAIGIGSLTAGVNYAISFVPADFTIESTTTTTTA